MKYLPLLILLAGCEYDFTLERVTEVAALCDANGGIHRLYAIGDGQLSVRCKNGAIFYSHKILP